MEQTIFGLITIALGTTNLFFADKYFAYNRWIYKHLMGIEIVATKRYFQLAKIMSFILIGFGTLVILRIIEL